MSKPQVASEPTMEEILASIRKMISDDKPGPSPMPDQMGRTPFGEPAKSSPIQEPNTRPASGENTPVSGAIAAAAPSFNSLADALKVATALSEQRRSLEQDIGTAIEKTPRNNLEALAEVSAAARADAARATTEGRVSTPVEPKWPLPAGASERRSHAAAAVAEVKRDLLSFDFGTVVPYRDDVQVETQTEEAVTQETSFPATVSEAPVVKVESIPESFDEPRVLPLRVALNGVGGPGLAGAGPNVAPFPRPVLEVVRSAPAEATVTANEVAEVTPESVPAPVAAEPSPLVPQSAIEEPSPPSDPVTDPSEALLDAVVDLVHQQPNALSVFASGASFVTGVGGIKIADEVAAAQAEAQEPEPAGVPDAPPAKLDRAAAELLRPMLRQWLAENMERILEEALRSELSEQSRGGNGPGKA